MSTTNRNLFQMAIDRIMQIRQLNKYAQWLLISLVLVSTIALLSLRVKLVLVPKADYGGVEQNLVYGIQRIAAGHPLYENPEMPPYSIIQYSPLHYYLVSTLMSIMDVNPDNVYHVYISNRAACLFFNLVTLVVIWLICTRLLQINKLTSLFVTLAAFAYFTVGHYGRNDSLYILLFCISLYFLIKSINGDKRLNLILAGLVGMTAIAAKQTAVNLIPLCLVSLCFNWKLKESLQIVGVMIGTAVVVLAIVGAEELTLFFQNAVLGVNNGIELFHFYNKFHYFFESVGIWIIGGLFCAIYLLSRRLKQDIFLAIATLFLLLFGALTSLKFGSGPNYFTEFLICSFIIIGYSYELLKSRISGPWVQVMVLTVFTYFTLLRTMSSVWKTNYPMDFTLLDNEREVAAYVLSNIDQDKSVMVFDHPIVRYRGFLSNLLHDHVILTQRSVIDCCSSNVFDFSSLELYISQGNVEYIIVKERDIPETYLKVDLANRYKKEVDINGYYIYRFVQPEG